MRLRSGSLVSRSSTRTAGAFFELAGFQMAGHFSMFRSGRTFSGAVKEMGSALAFLGSGFSGGLPGISCAGTGCGLVTVVRCYFLNDTSFVLEDQTKSVGFVFMTHNGLWWSRCCRLSVCQKYLRTVSKKYSALPCCSKTTENKRDCELCWVAPAFRLHQASVSSAPSSAFPWHQASVSSAPSSTFPWHQGKRLSGKESKRTFVS
jgi:hypothetical protein